MKSAKTIDIQDWMTSALSKRVVEALGHGNALFVGGCVRNALLGRAVNDVDMTTVFGPDEVMARLEKAGVKTIPTGIDHGTITAVLDKDIIEITTLRKDLETDGRHAVVAFTDSWLEDAKRRDFTMNTLLANEKGEIFDPLEQGLNDLENRKVIFVGNPDERIKEDALRILRFFRFYAEYGEGALDDDGLKACAKAADSIPNLSIERITQEFFKILSVKHPVPVLGIMCEHNILTDVIPAQAGISSNRKKIPDQVRDDSVLRLLDAVCHFQSEYNLKSVATRLFVLAGLENKSFETLKEGLLVPKVFQKDIEAIQKVLALRDLSDDHAVKVAVYKYGRTATAQALMIELAQDRVKNAYAPGALDIIQNWDVPTFPVSGEDLIKKGFNPGPKLGRELDQLEKEWIDNGFV